MTRSIACLSVSFSLWLATAGTASGQAVLEYGLGASRAATSAAPAAGLGKSMSGLAGSVDRALKMAGKQGPPEQAPTAAVAAPKPPSIAAVVPPVPVPAPTWEDPSGIEPGLQYDELLSRFGPSAMAITDGVERSLTYRGKDGMFQVKVQDGTVKTIAKPRPRA